MDIIRIAERSELPLKQTIKELNVSKSTFYNWYNRYLDGGPYVLKTESHEALGIKYQIVIGLRLLKWP